jgi:hypothetical protein
MVARDDEVAVEAIWTGVLKGDMGPLKAGDTLRIYTAFFFIVPRRQDRGRSARTTASTRRCREPPLVVWQPVRLGDDD